MREGKVFREAMLEDGLKRLEPGRPKSSYLALGRGQVTSGELLEAVFPGMKDAGELRPQDRERIDDERGRLYVHGRGLTPGSACISPIAARPCPAIALSASLTPGKGVQVHVIDCEVLAALEDDSNLENWIDLKWTPETKNAVSVGRVNATVRNEPGVLAEMAGIVGEAGGNISDVKTLERTRDFFTMSFDIEVFDARHLVNILSRR
jgi:guanosine-3',5'-bis(diphosphate) 3'-pyrophosphohydrolase